MSLISLQFLGLALCAVLLLPVLRGPARWLVFFGLNALYARSFLEPVGIVSTAAFCLAGYGFARLANAGRRGSVVGGIVVLTAAFVYMRSYGVLPWILPDSWITQALVTAGLSFLFFKMIHVVVDAGSGTLGELRLGTYLNYCFNFTTFLLGPIQRYQDFDEQWSGRRPALADGFEPQLDAFNRLLRGLVKKFVLAELLRNFSIQPGLELEALSAGELLVRIYVFYLYLYCDFSGYCDIVIGIGSLMGVRPPENFYLPFFSRNVSEYWLRVHRSLTLWLTDYVFTPCYAANLRSSLFRGRAFAALAASLMVTMFVSGLWHGTTLSFLLFGITHGVYLTVHRGYEHIMIRRLGRPGFRRWSQRPAVHVAAVFLTYNVTSLAYLFFVLDAKEVGAVIAKLVGA